jgi:hypothetical protein
MKRTVLAIALAAGASAALAQAPAAPAAAPAAPEVPAAKCEPKPAYPGLKALQDERKRETFQKDLKSYQDCIRIYVGERKAAVDANNAAMRVAVEEHNAIMTKIRAEQDAAVPPEARTPEAAKDAAKK